jgi:hypothetical protein
MGNVIAFPPHEPEIRYPFRVEKNADPELGDGGWNVVDASGHLITGAYSTKEYAEEACKNYGHRTAEDGERERWLSIAFGAIAKARIRTSRQSFCARCWIDLQMSPTGSQALLTRRLMPNMP